MQSQLRIGVAVIGVLLILLGVVVYRRFASDPGVDLSIDTEASVVESPLAPTAPDLSEPTVVKHSGGEPSSIRFGSDGPPPTVVRDPDPLGPPPQSLFPDAYAEPPRQSQLPGWPFPSPLEGRELFFEPSIR